MATHGPDRAILGLGAANALGVTEHKQALYSATKRVIVAGQDERSDYVYEVEGIAADDVLTDVYVISYDFDTDLVSRFEVRDVTEFTVDDDEVTVASDYREDYSEFTSIVFEYQPVA